MWITFLEIGMSMADPKTPKPFGCEIYWKMLARENENSTNFYHYLMIYVYYRQRRQQRKRGISNSSNSNGLKRLKLRLGDETMLDSTIDL